MKDIINCLNQNGITFTDIITLLYVALTAFIVWYTRKALKEQLKPYIVVDIISQNHFIYLRIRNIGKSVAMPVEIKIEPSMDDILDGDDDRSKKYINIKPILKQPTFTPGYEIKFMITSTIRFLKIKDRERKYEYNFDILYSDESKKEYSGRYTIDLDRIVYEEKVTNFDNTHYLYLIDKKLEKLNEILDKKLK